MNLFLFRFPTKKKKNPGKFDGKTKKQEEKKNNFPKVHFPKFKTTIKQNNKHLRSKRKLKKKKSA